MPVGTLLRIVLTWFQSANGKCQNTHHLRVVIGGITQTTLENDVAAWVTAMFARYRLNMPTSAVFQPVAIYQWVAGEGFVFLVNVNATATGTVTTDVLPPYTAPLVTARVAPNGVAKKYLPAPCEIFQANGQATAELMTNMIDYTTRFVVGPNLIRYQPVTVKQVGESTISYRNFGLVGVAANTLSYQTRRKRGRGV